MDSDCPRRMILPTEKAEAHFHPARAKACTTSPEVDSGCSKFHRGASKVPSNPTQAPYQVMPSFVRIAPRSAGADAKVCPDRAKVRAR
jgi:hypothetical protein